MYPIQAQNQEIPEAQNIIGGTQQAWLYKALIETQSPRAHQAENQEENFDKQWKKTAPPTLAVSTKYHRQGVQ